jgi:hypothetical protein
MRLESGRSEPILLGEIPKLRLRALQPDAPPKDCCGSTAPDRGSGGRVRSHPSSGSRRRGHHNPAGGQSQTSRPLFGQPENGVTSVPELPPGRAEVL